MLAPQVVAHLGVHTHYVEVFSGSAAVLFAKERSRVETIDAGDDDVVNLFRVMAAPDLAASLAIRCAHTAYARREFVAARELLEASPAPLCGTGAQRVERAWAFLVAVNFSVSNTPHSTGWSRAVTDPGGSIPPDRWVAVCGRLAGAAERLRGVQVDCADWREVLERYDRPTTVFYLDPPYHHECRSGGRYRHDLSASEHVELVDTLLELSGAAVLSGFAHPVHDRLLDAGWKVAELVAPATRRRSAKPPVTLWVSPQR